MSLKLVLIALFAILALALAMPASEKISPNLTAGPSCSINQMMVCAGSIDEVIAECVPECSTPSTCLPCIKKVFGADFGTCCQCIQWWAETYDIPDLQITC